MDKQHRHLAAILFTDIVGYTAIMQQDEQKAVSTIKKHNSVLSEAADTFHGEILNNYGDGCLCIFPSALDAVQAALSIQERLRQRIPLFPSGLVFTLAKYFSRMARYWGWRECGIESSVARAGQYHIALFRNPQQNP